MIGAAGDILGVLAALVVVSALAVGAVWLLKRFQLGGPLGAPASEEVRFVRALPVGPRERLVVVEWRGETLLLGVAAGGISLLDRRAGPPPS